MCTCQNFFVHEPVINILTFQAFYVGKPVINILTCQCFYVHESQMNILTFQGFFVNEPVINILTFQDSTLVGFLCQWTHGIHQYLSVFLCPQTCAIKASLFKDTMYTCANEPLTDIVFCPTTPYTNPHLSGFCVHKLLTKILLVCLCAFLSIEFLNKNPVWNLLYRVVF